MKKSFLRLLVVLIFCLGLCVSAYAGEALLLTDPNQFPYPENQAVYIGDDCLASVYFLGWLQAVSAPSPYGSFRAYAQDLAKLVNTASMINAQQEHYIGVYFYDSSDVLIWSGQVPVSASKYNANTNRIKVYLKINDASLRDELGEDYSQARDILLNSWLRLDGSNWVGTCSAPRMIDSDT